MSICRAVSKSSTPPKLCHNPSEMAGSFKPLAAACKASGYIDFQPVDTPLKKPFQSQNQISAFARLPRTGRLDDLFLFAPILLFAFAPIFNPPIFPNFANHLFFQPGIQSQIFACHGKGRILADSVMSFGFWAGHYFHDPIDDMLRLACTRNDLIEHRSQKPPVPFKHRTGAVIKIHGLIGVGTNDLGL